jgi:hypothetical protein
LVNHQRVQTRVGDAVRVILAAECDGVLRPVEEGGRRLLCGDNLVPLPLALAAGHVDSRPPPEDEEDVLHGGEAASVTITPVLLGLVVLRGGAAVETLEHVALLEGMVDRRFMAGTWLLQHVVENSWASRGWSTAPSSRVNSESFAAVVVVPLLARLAARLLSLLAPLVLLAGVLGLAALRGRVVYAFALLAVEDRPHRLFA